MNIKKLNDDSVIPTKGSEYAAGMDLYSYIPEETLYIPVGATCKIGTGIAAEIPEGLVLYLPGAVLRQREVLDLLIV